MVKVFTKNCPVEKETFERLIAVVKIIWTRAHFRFSFSNMIFIQIKDWKINRNICFLRINKIDLFSYKNMRV